MLKEATIRVRDGESDNVEIDRRVLHSLAALAAMGVKLDHRSYIDGTDDMRLAGFQAARKAMHESVMEEARKAFEHVYYHTGVKYMPDLDA